MKTIFVRLVGVLLLSPSLWAFAQTYPAKAVNLVVPYPAGGRTDLTGRLVAQFLKDELAQPVVVVNKSGASGVLGAMVSLGSAPDGYTLFLSTGFSPRNTLCRRPPASLIEVDRVINTILPRRGIATKGWKTLAEAVRRQSKPAAGARH